MADHGRKRSHTPKGGHFSPEDPRRGTSPQQVPSGSQHVQLAARSPTITSTSKPSDSFLGGRPPSSPPQAISNKQPSSFIAQSRASMKGSPMVTQHYMPEENSPTSPNSRERTTTISSLLYREPTKRSIEDKMERLVALREAIHGALADVFSKLETIDATLKMITQPNSDIAVTLREIAKFLRNLIDDSTSTPAAPAFPMDAQVSNGQDRLQFFKDVMHMALVEIRCKLGSLQKRISETTSLTTCIYDANTVRTLKLYLEGKGTLELDPKKHKIIGQADETHRAKLAQLATAVSRTCCELTAHLAGIDLDTALVCDILAVVESDEEIPYGTGGSVLYSSLFPVLNDDDAVMSGTPPQSAGPDVMSRVIAQLTNWNEQVQILQNEDEQEPSPELVALLTHFANKMRKIKKRLMAVERSAAITSLGERLATPNDSTPYAKMGRLIAVLRRERDEGSKGEANEEIQEDISTLNTRRHLLTLSIRNLDRKINFLIKSRKHKEEATEMEEEEVYQFFDQTTSEENPLGQNKENYEQFISVIRKQPRYLASMVKFLSFAEMEPLVQTITFSLFSDLYLAREEYLMLSLIDAIMTAEFESCKDVEAYLRGNSFITKLLSGYTKRQSGRQHLSQALKESIMSVIKDIDLDLEMDPAKLYKQIVVKDNLASAVPDVDEPATPDEGASTASGTTNGKVSYEAMANHPDVKAAFNEHKFKLVYFCKLFLENIVGSLPTMPFGLRWIAKQLVVKAKEKFGDTLTQASIDILIGGFIFLRYLCPAIVAPESHGIVSHVTGSARRNLVLIAKVLQNLANQCQFSKKEVFMAPMNTFLADHAHVLREYFSVLVMVGDSSSYYRASSLKRTQPHQIERTVTISPNELYDIHRKLVKHQDATLKTQNDPLAQLLKKMNPIPENLPRRQNKFVLLNVYSLVDDQQEESLSEEQQFINSVKEKLVQVLPLIEDRALVNAGQNMLSSLHNANGINEVPSTTSIYSPSSSSVPTSPPLSPRIVPTTTTPSQRHNYSRTVVIGKPNLIASSAAQCSLRDALLACHELQIPSAVDISVLLTDLDKIPPALADNNFFGLLDQMEKDYQQRAMVRDALLTEKVEQLEALEHQKKEVARLMEEKKIYSQYLTNVMLDAYLKKIKNKPMIGPYKFSVKQLEKAGVIVNPSTIANQNNVVIKMSCTNPGSVNITTKYQKYSKFYELQLLDLMDDLVLHDISCYDDINFDTRKLISFLNRYILG